MLRSAQDDLLTQVRFFPLVEMKGRVSKDEGIASSITEDSRLKYKILFRDFLNFVFCGFALRRCVMSFFAF